MKRYTRISKTVVMAMALASLLVAPFASAEQALPPMNNTSGQTVAQAGNAQQNGARPTLEDVSSINHIEDQLYGSHDQAEAFENRLARIEQTMFGQSRADAALRDRLNYIYETFNNVQPKKSEAAPPVNESFYVPQQQQQQAQQEPDATDYPAVTALEQKVFGKTFPNEQLSKRLDALELATFKTAQRGALVDRVENLQLLVFGDTGQRQVSTVTPQQNSVPYNYNPYNGFPQQAYQGDPYVAASQQQQYQQPQQYPSASPYNYQQPYNYQPITQQNPNQGVIYQPTDMANNTNQGDMIAATTQLEQQLFRKTYPMEPLPQRLDRIEGRLFNGTSPEMSEQDRLDRILAVSAGGGDKQGPTTASKKKDILGAVLPMALILLLGLL